MWHLLFVIFLRLSISEEEVLNDKEGDDKEGDANDVAKDANDANDTDAGAAVSAATAEDADHIDATAATAAAATINNNNDAAMPPKVHPTASPATAAEKAKRKSAAAALKTAGEYNADIDISPTPPPARNTPPSHSTSTSTTWVPCPTTPRRASTTLRWRHACQWRAPQERLPDEDLQCRLLEVPHPPHLLYEGGRNSSRPSWRPPTPTATIASSSTTL